MTPRDARAFVTHFGHSAPFRSPYVSAISLPEGSRVSEVSDEGVRLGVSSELTAEAHLVTATQLQSTMAQWKRPHCAYFVLTTWGLGLAPFLRLARLKVISSN